MAFAQWLNSKTTNKICIRFTHGFLTAAIVGTIIYKDTELHYAIKNQDFIYVLSYFILVLLSLAMYYTTCWVDPGYVVMLPKQKQWTNNSDDEEDTTEQTTMLAQDKPDTIKLRKCGFCGIKQPMRARHCEECGRCVRKYDHHCPWLETCIGERNHKYFWIFVVTETALIAWTAWIVWHAFVFHLSWSEWFRTNGILLAVTAVLCVGGVVTACLACMHTYLMITNSTTWEVVSRHRISYLKMLDEELNPFHEGYCRNMYRFMCQRGQRGWEAIYSRKTASEQHDV